MLVFECVRVCVRERQSQNKASQIACVLVFAYICKCVCLFLSVYVYVYVKRESQDKASSASTAERKCKKEKREHTSLVRTCLFYTCVSTMQLQKEKAHGSRVSMKGAAPKPDIASFAERKNKK